MEFDSVLLLISFIEIHGARGDCFQVCKRGQIPVSVWTQQQRGKFR